ncbi:MAG TPA: serine/threonine-protein kinase, partial [Myxococcaceae bacterium]|nr:serine/threonine-protein kinase [Myxococcaceae bacterium]
MPGFAPEEWLSLRPHLDRALETEGEERAALLKSLAAENPSLAERLRAVLEEHRALKGEHFLESSLAVPTAPSLAGQTFGAYTLERPLGQGGMGTVWLARRSDGQFEGHFAVKLLNLALVGSAAEERFRREGTLLARMSHPNIARLVDAGVTPTGQPYLVLEHVEGISIDAYCAQRSLDLAARLELVLQVLAAVAHSHANLVIHRDIKPSNVLVTPAGQAKLLDFGIGKLVEDQRFSAGAAELTATAVQALTPAYAAPEQLSDGLVTVATDVYSLGVLLYVLLAGQHPAGSEVHSPSGLI